MSEIGIVLTGFTLLWPGLIDGVLGQKYSIMDSWGVSRGFFELVTFGSFILICLVGVVFYLIGRARVQGRRRDHRRSCSKASSKTHNQRHAVRYDEAGLRGGTPRARASSVQAALRSAAPLSRAAICRE